MNLLNPFGPAGHFRQFLFTPRHRRTPSPDNGLFYPIICDCSTSLKLTARFRLEQGGELRLAPFLFC